MENLLMAGCASACIVTLLTGDVKLLWLAAVCGISAALVAIA